MVPNQRTSALTSTQPLMYLQKTLQLAFNFPSTILEQQKRRTEHIGSSVAQLSEEGT